jgi:hypothetical protein
MLKWTHFAIIIGILCVFFLLTRTKEKQQEILVLNQTQIHVLEPTNREEVAEPTPIRLRYEQQEDPLLYVDDGMYYKNPLTIEGNRLWIEQRPKTNDLEWGLPLYTDRWSGGVYNGSYKTYSS